MILFLHILISLIAGIFPVLVWLWLFEHEDKNPEPAKLTALAFLAGMAAVIISLVLEGATKLYYPDITPELIIIWAIIEEGAKFACAYIAVLRRKENDEPIDSIMYMITVALGFAALENALFFIVPLINGNIAEAVLNGSVRVFGATLLHVITSGIVGAALSFSFYLSRATRELYLGVGLILATALHSLFNLSILFGTGSTAIFAFFGVWTFCIILLIIFQKVKHITSNQP